jgi:glutamate mutase epsilon subunit
MDVPLNIKMSIENFRKVFIDEFCGIFDEHGISLNGFSSDTVYEINFNKPAMETVWNKWYGGYSPYESRTALELKDLNNG